MPILVWLHSPCLLKDLFRSLVLLTLAGNSATMTSAETDNHCRRLCSLLLRHPSMTMSKTVKFVMKRLARALGEVLEVVHSVGSTSTLLETHSPEDLVSCLVDPLKLNRCDRVLTIGERVPMGVESSNDTFDAWRATTSTHAGVAFMARTYWKKLSDLTIAAGPEHVVTIWEDQEQVSASSAPMGMSNSDSDSEDGMFYPPSSTYKIADLFLSRDLQTGQDRRGGGL